jgi:presenilin-like A22 family membrane protease
MLRVNNVHFKHHKNVHTNLGPDICDILFSTKNESDDDVENTNHYIPNIIIITILIMFLKHICKNDIIQQKLLFIITIIAVFFCIFIIITSIKLHNYNSHEQIEKPIEKPIEETNEK